MAVDMDRENKEAILAWEEHALGRVYEVMRGELQGRHFRIVDSYRSTETIEGIKAQARSFRYEWMDTAVEEIVVKEGVVTVTTTSESRDDPSRGIERVSAHKTKAENGIYHEIGYHA